MAVEAQQSAIKWWKYCQVCEWTGRPMAQDTDVEFCPNCNNPHLSVRIDDHVYNGKRYDARVRNQMGQAIADEVRQNQGRPPAPNDRTNENQQGHQYGPNEDKPFPDPP